MKKSQISFSKNVIASAPVLSEACGERSRTVEGAGIQFLSLRAQRGNLKMSFSKNVIASAARQSHI